MSTSASTDVEHIQWSLHAVAETARQIDTRSFEVDARPRIRAELVPAVVRVMDNALGVLGHVLDRYDRPQEVESPANSGVFHAVFDDMVADQGPGSPHQRIADISFMARWELDRKRSSVAEAEHGRDDWRLIAECCSARRRVVKAASGVERVLSEVESQPSVFTDLYQTERGRALETRAAYYSFVSGLRATERRFADLERRIRLAGTGIARLIGRSIYEELRVEDRRSIRAVQARLFEWLRGARDPREGLRLLSEVNSCASLLMEVNRRPILLEHDREVLEQLLRALSQPATNSAVFYKLLVSIRGRDLELDELIEASAALEPRVWREPVDRVLAGLREQAVGA
ncbi:MAG: hypothetical protein R6X02_35650 [Enhygromyxa sp.]